MNFATAEFLVFVVALLGVYWAIPHSRVRRVLLLAASYYFYACWDPRFLALIVGSTVLDYAMGAVIASSPSASRRRAALVASCVGNLGVLGIFKYLGFFAASLSALAATIGWRLGPLELELLLPIGISFYTFQTMSYTIDLYRGQIERCRDPLDFALFVAFFPQLVAGPIVRAAHFLPQLARDHRLDLAQLGSGLERIVIGLAKKVVIADSLAVHADAVFSAPGEFGAAATWLGVLAFAGQIYGDFSGYSDIAIGTARCFGYELPENFRHPYGAKSPQEFWRRWHISLSTWLRDYLYIPLGGNRGSQGRTHANLIATMLLGGLWHGAAWTFVAWGLYHGLLLSIHRVWRVTLLPRNVIGEAARVVGTFALVLFGWILFRAERFADVPAIVAAMCGAGGAAEALPLATGAIGLLALVAIMHAFSFAEDEDRAAWTRSTPLRAAAITGACIGIPAFWRTDPTAFIYFQF